jgi:ABC-2 type transport system ATP-binding protein
MGLAADRNQQNATGAAGRQPALPGSTSSRATTPGGSANWLFELREVHHRYGRTEALHDLTVQVPIDSIGLVGQNGAGKSTLMQILLGLIHPTQGAARVLGRDVRSHGLVLRGVIGYMSEREAFIPGLKGVEYVALAGQLSGMPGRQAWRRAHETLSSLGLEEARYRRLEEYSVGMKQRLKLAAALVHDPDVLLLDEPTAGLDPEGRSAMLSVLSTLARRPNKALVLSSHLLSDVERVCRWAVILDQGRLLHNGPLEGLLTARPRRYRLRWQATTADRFLDALRSHGVDVQPAPNGQEALVEVPEVWTNRTLFREAIQHDVTITGLQPDEENLEAVYQRLVTRGKPRDNRA